MALPSEDSDVSSPETSEVRNEAELKKDSFLVSVFKEWMTQEGRIYSLDGLTSLIAARSLEHLPLDSARNVMGAVRLIVKDLLLRGSLDISYSREDGVLLELSVFEKSEGSWEASWRMSDVDPKSPYGESKILGQYQDAPLDVREFPDAFISTLRGFFEKAVVHRFYNK